MEDLLAGKTFCTQIDEQIVFNQLTHNESAVWSLLLASGHLKVENCVLEDGLAEYELALTNREVRLMFHRMIEDWFSHYTPFYNDFVKAYFFSVYIPVRPLLRAGFYTGKQFLPAVLFNSHIIIFFRSVSHGYGDIFPLFFWKVNYFILLCIHMFHPLRQICTFSCTPFYHLHIML